jgi:hypothetical protein
MAEIMGKWPSRRGQLTKTGLPGGCGVTTIPSAVQFEYCRHEFDDYKENGNEIDS